MDEQFEILQSLGAGDFQHLNGSLVEHLTGTEHVLKSWGASEVLATAGLFHAAYGTAGFDDNMVSLSQREKIANLIGEQAEALVYLYCSCERDYVFSQFANQQGDQQTLSSKIVFRDRFTGAEFHLAKEQWVLFCELTTANELELVYASDSFKAQYGNELFELFESIQPFLTLEAKVAYQLALGDVVPTSQIMNLYNQHERKVFTAFDGDKVSTPEVVKLVANEAYGSYISFFDLNENNASQHIRQEVDYFRQLERNFEWKTYSSDKPSNIGELLLEHDFQEAESESFMILDLCSANPIIGNQSFSEVSDSKGIRDAIRVQEQVWGGDFEWQYQYLLNLKTESPESVSIYVVYANGVPVTSAWITFNGDSPFAGIWGGSTVKEHRGNGYYSMLLNQRILDAKSRGKRYLIIDASEMSRPIVEKYGFKFVATTIGYEFQATS